MLADGWQGAMIHASSGYRAYGQGVRGMDTSGTCDKVFLLTLPVLVGKCPLQLPNHA